MSLRGFAAPIGRRNQAPTMIQRQCACGTHAGGGECDACRKKKLRLQRRDRARPDPIAQVARSSALPHTHDVGAARGFSRPASYGKTIGPALRTTPQLQRQPIATTTRPAPARPELAERGAAPESSPALPSESVAAEQQPAGLIAEDDATELEAGQLRKSDFLDQLETAVCAAAERKLAGTGQSTDGCPHLSFWFGYYRRQSGSHVESALRRYAPEARDLDSASAYIPLVAARIREGVARWAGTGEITGVPDGIPLAAAGVVGGAIGTLAPTVGSVLFKVSDGGHRAADDPAAVRQELGSGRPLPSSVSSRMGQAFDRSFADVRIHTDTAAHRLSTQQNARAFTVGGHVAFGPGEYRPGTPVGDALIAHELAHVVQQGGSSATTQTKPPAGTSYETLEDDADRSALGVVASLCGQATRTVAGAARDMAPALKSGLRLQRCASRPATTTHPEATVRPEATVQPGETAPSEADKAAAARAEAIDTLVSDPHCQPTPIALDKMAAIPGTSLTNFGWTQPAKLSRSIDPDFDRRKGECFLAGFKAADLAFDHMKYVEPGEHRYGTQTRRDDTCGKELPLFVEVTPEAANLFKAGEVEHCRDIRRAFDLTMGRFKTAAAAVKAEGRFPAKNKGDCTAKIKEKIGKRMGFDYDQLRPIFVCLYGKSKERDTKGWHNVDVNLTKEKKTDPGCTRIVHVLDDTRILPEVGKHPTAALVKGCGEPEGE